MQSPVAEGARGQVSKDGRVAFATVQYSESANEIGKDADAKLGDASRVAERAGIEVARGGQVVEQGQQSTAPIGELIGIALAIVVLTLFFRSAAAMALTLASAGIAIAGGMMLLTFGSAFADFPSFAPTLGIMLGLGAGIDYALLIVGRYREQLAAGDDVPHAAAVANSTAGTSVIAAGAIVVVAISGLLVIGIPFLGRMGVGSAIIVASVAVGAVTILPSLLGAGAKRLRPKDVAALEPSPRLARFDEWVTLRPLRAVAIGLALLAILAAPFSALRLGQPDAGNDARDTTTRKAYDNLAEGFGPGFNGQLSLAAAVPDGGRADLVKVRAAIAGTRDVAAVSAPRYNTAGDTAVMSVVPASSPQDDRTSELVHRLRDETIPAATADNGVKVYVGGATAVFEDLSAKVADRLPVFILMVVGLSILLLMAVFRSIWVPLVSAAFNLLSILAAYGVVVAVFQWGWGSQLLGVDGQVPIVSFVPLFMFAVLFGLSMDYNVFLQSRIREEYLKGATARESVLRGLARVSKLILAAGAIMTAVFLGFATDPDVVVKTIGVGLAAAIVIDVLIVRMLVAPAVMTLLGDRAWWFPAWLDRVLPRISLEGEAGEPAEERELVHA